MLSNESDDTQAHEGGDGAKPKNLAVGTAAYRGASTAITGGVATSRALETQSSSKNKEQAARAAQVNNPDATVVDPNDPNVELPMYRDGMDWFVLRVASNKENTVRDTLLRKVQIEAMQHLVGRIMV
ncbi:MAG: hypothetical protein ACKPEA_06545, partial [Planctomycetota bacterium]